MDYIKKYHTTGLSWNPNGGDAKRLFGSTASAGPAGGPPPPPAAPKQPLTSTPSAKPSSNAAAALFAEINKVFYFSIVPPVNVAIFKGTVG